MTAQISSYFLRITYSIFLASGGVFLNSSYRGFELPYSLFFTIWMLITILGSVIGFANFPAAENRIEVLIQISSHSVMLALHWAIKLNQRRLRAFAGYLNVKTCPKYVGFQAIHLAERLFKKFMFVMSLFVLFMFMVCFISLITPFVVDLNFKDSSVYVIPFWFMCDKSGKSKFLIPFLCYHVDRKSKFILMNMAQTIVFVIELTSYVTSFAFYAFSQIFVRAHVAVVTEKIANMSDMAKNQLLKLDESAVPRIECNRDRLYEIDYNDIIYLEMVNVIKHHCYLHRTLNNVLGYLRVMVATSLTGFCFVIVFSAYLVVTESGMASAILFKMKMISIMANAGIMFFLYCHGAETTNNASKNIANAVYDMPWFKQSIRFRKMIIPFLIQLQKDFEVRAYGTYRINLMFFMSVVRLVYSALNMLLLALDKQKLQA